MISMMFFLDFTLQYVGDDHNPWESRWFFRDDIEFFFITAHLTPVDLLT